MRKIGWSFTVLALIMVLTESFAYADGIGGWINLIGNSSKNYEDGEQTSATESYNRNYYLKFNKAVTPMLSYQINLRANLQDTDTTDASDTTTRSFRRKVEPALDVTLRNSVYDVGLGFRRQEEWSSTNLRGSEKTASVFSYIPYTLNPGEWSTPALKDKDRDTSDFYYARIGVVPKALPSLTINLDSQEDLEYTTGLEGSDESRRRVRKNDAYSISSSYELPSRDMKFRYNFNFTHNEEKTPLQSTEKTKNDNFNGSYNVGYNRKFMGGSSYYSFSYQGNYAKSENEQFFTETGSFESERSLNGGLYAKGNSTDNRVDELESFGSLIVDEFTATSIDIGSDDLINNRFHNMGVVVAFQRSVDRLYVYVNKNVMTDTSLTNPDNWIVSKSNVIEEGAWEDIDLSGSSINVEPIDAISNIYRYELVLAASHEATYFRIVSLRASDIANVAVTKIEAWGTDTTNDTTSTSESSSFTQGVDMSANMRLTPRISMSLNYSLNRNDQNPESVDSSIYGVFRNIFSDSVSGDDEDFRSSVTRNYGLTTKWLTHKLLTTTLRLQRNENFDNLDETDTHSNSYHLSFNSVPIATLDATLSLIRSDRFDFNEKESTNNTALLSVGSQLYRDVNMINDFGYTETEAFDNDTETSSYTLNGSIDALITKEVSGTLNYAYTNTESDGSSSVAKEILSSINYQPGRFINISGNMNVSDSAGDMTFSMGVLADWLPLRALRLNANYQHTEADPGPTIIDSVGGYGIWYITKFADLRFSYNYSRTKEETKVIAHNASANLNCRF